MRFTKVSPNPHPRLLVVKPGLNTVLKFLRGMPFPVSFTKMVATCWSMLCTVMWMLPSPLIASTAFLVRFSITHSKSDWQSITPQFCSSLKWSSRFTRLGMRLLIYSSEVCTASLMNSSSLSGIEPIFENRSAIFDRRFTSLSMS